MCSREDNQPRLFALPGPNETGYSTSDAEPYGPLANDLELSGLVGPERPTFVLTLEFDGIVTTKTWTLPLPWFASGAAKDISAEFVASAISDMVIATSGS